MVVPVPVKLNVNKECQCLWKQILVTTAANLLFISGGCTYGYSAILLPLIKEDHEFSYDEKYDSWIAATAPLFMALGCLISGIMADNLGRKLSHIILLWPFMIGWLINAFAADVTFLIIARVLTGVCTGMFKTISTIYIGEISNPRFRSMMLFSLSLSTSIGIIFSHVMGGFFHWKTCSIIFGTPILIAFILLVFVRESPLWLISKGRTFEGIENFKWYRFMNELSEKELSDVLEKQSSKTTEITFKELLCVIFSRSFMKPFLTILLIFSVYYFSGVATFVFYAQDLIKDSFSSKIDPFFFMIVVDCIRTLTVLLMFVFGNRLPRRKAFLISGSATCFLLLGKILCLSFLSRRLEWIAVIFLIFYNTFGVSLGALSWSVISEVFPNNTRGLGASLSGAFAFLLLFITIKITIILLAFGTIVLYSVCLVITSIMIVITYFVFPETNGKTLQEIEDGFAKQGEK